MHLQRKVKVLNNLSGTTIKKIFHSLIILCISTYAYADISLVELSLKQENKTSPYGKWTLDKRNPKQIDKMFRGKIVKNIGRAAPYIIEQSDIEIFNRSLYTHTYLQKGAYDFGWEYKKNSFNGDLWDVSDQTKEMIKKSTFFKTYEKQRSWKYFDWPQALADYLNSTISPIPSLVLKLKNETNHTVSITGFTTKPVYTTGGEASPGAEYFKPLSNNNLLAVTWEKPVTLTLKKPTLLKTHHTQDITLSIYVKKGAQGDGPGSITYALYVDYSYQGKQKSQFLTLISQSEDNGFDTGW